MKMFEQAGEFKPDSLLAGNGFPVMVAGIGLKAGQGILKRGSLIIKGADGAGSIAGAAEGKICGILTDDYDTGPEDGEEASAGNIPATVYQTGEFNREAMIVSGEGATVESLEEDMKAVGIYLRGVQNYEQGVDENG